MKFNLIDDVIETTDDRIVAVKQVSLAEEYLADHFPGFPVLPGVLMLEAMVQAARHLLGLAGGDAGSRHVLGGVKALKYGAMVRPGESLRVDVTLVKRGSEAEEVSFRGTGTVIRGRGSGPTTEETAVSGRFTMRPIRPGLASGNARGSVPTA